MALKNKSRGRLQTTYNLPKPKNSVCFYQSTYILPRFRNIVSFKGFLQKSNNEENLYSFKIQHRILNKSEEPGNWINDKINITSKGDLEKEVNKYLKSFYQENFY
jgi:hypothetical protein